MTGLPAADIGNAIDSVLKTIEAQFGVIGMVSIMEVLDCVRKLRAPHSIVVVSEETVETIFGYWKTTMSSPRSVLDKKRRKLIEEALKHYSPADICKAIRGCSKSPHHMGENKQRTMYNGLNLILRDAEYIDKFIALDAGTARSTVESVETKNARAIAAFLGTPVNDSNTLDMEG